MAALLVALAWLLLLPHPAAAWGPATHVALGQVVLGALYLVPPAIRALLERYPLDFLYGSIAADISFAKKYVPEGRHCHNWAIGEEILEAADTDRLRAGGYLAHLAADTIAHNIFVPRQLLLTSTTKTLGHAYWEHRMDLHVGDEFLRQVRVLVIENDHSDADQLLDDVLSRTIFRFKANRKIFRGMIRLTGDERWQRVFGQVVAKSHFDLPNSVVDRYFELAFEQVIDYLTARADSGAAQLDLVGELNLKLAKKVRRRALSDHSVDQPGVLTEMADAFFPFPDGSLRFRPEVRDPAFKAGVSVHQSESSRDPGALGQS